MTSVQPCLMADREEKDKPQANVRLPDNPFRHTVVILLREQLEKEVETEHLVDWIEGLWDTVDTLVHRFGAEEANKIIHARSAIPSFAGGSL